MSENKGSEAYVISPEMRDRLQSDYAHFTPKNAHLDRYAVAFSDAAHQLARHVCMVTPPGHDQSLALTHLQVAAFYVNHAIAQDEWESSGREED